jgi:hypothetical protein
MPRKKNIDKEPGISETVNISGSEEQPVPRRRSKKKTEDIPFAEVLPETGNDDDKMDVPHFSKTDESPITSAVEADALDVAIEEARSYPQSVQDEPIHNSAVSEEQPAPEIIHSRQIFPAEVAPPPLMILAFAGIMLIYILAST